jgi:DNA-directed RNA polymerase specialized sigma24 family protein
MKGRWEFGKKGLFSGKRQSETGCNMKRQNEAFGLGTIAVDTGPADVWNFPSHEFVPGSPIKSGLDVLERKDVLPRLAQRIAELPLWSQKMLAMYYYENLPISGIATCFDLPACRVNEILTQTVGSLRTEVLSAFKSP